MSNNNPLTQKHYLDEVFEQHKKRASIDAITESITNEFSPKPWDEEYKPMYNIVSIALPFLNLCSILLGFYFVYGLLNEGIGYWWLSGLLSVGLLSIIEYTKNFTVRKSSVAYLKHQHQQSTLLAVITAIIVLLSATTSMFGGDTIMQKAGLEMARKQTVTTQSTLQELQQRLDKINTDREAYRKRTGKTASWMAAAEATQIQSEIEQQRKRTDATLSEAKQTTNQSSNSVMLLTFLIEIGIVGAGIFKVYYAFRSYHTKQLAKNNQATPLLQLQHQHQQKTERYTPNTPQQTNTDTKISNNIGFKTHVATVDTVDTVDTDTAAYIMALKNVRSQIASWEAKDDKSSTKADKLLVLQKQKSTYEAKLKARNIELRLEDRKLKTYKISTNEEIKIA